MQPTQRQIWLLQGQGRPGAGSQHQGEEAIDRRQSWKPRPPDVIRSRAWLYGEIEQAAGPQANTETLDKSQEASQDRGWGAQRQEQDGAEQEEQEERI